MLVVQKRTLPRRYPRWVYMHTGCHAVSTRANGRSVWPRVAHSDRSYRAWCRPHNRGATCASDARVVPASAATSHSKTHPKIVFSRS
jgi:hypothetical protein